MDGRALVPVRQPKASAQGRGPSRQALEGVLLRRTLRHLALDYISYISRPGQGDHSDAMTIDLYEPLCRHLAGVLGTPQDPYSAIIRETVAGLMQEGRIPRRVAAPPGPAPEW